MTALPTHSTSQGHDIPSQQDHLTHQKPLHPQRQSAYMSEDGRARGDGTEELPLSGAKTSYPTHVRRIKSQLTLPPLRTASPWWVGHAIHATKHKHGYADGPTRSTTAGHRGPCTYVLLHVFPPPFAAQTHRIHFAPHHCSMRMYDQLILCESILFTFCLYTEKRRHKHSS